MKYLNFIEQYKKYIKRIKYPIITNINHLDLSKDISINIKTVTLKKSYEKIIKEIKKIDLEVKEEWIIFNFKDDRETLDPEFLHGLYGIKFFEINHIKKNVSHRINNVSFNDMGNWYLVKQDAFFKVRNCVFLYEKYLNEDFSEIDQIILGHKKLEDAGKQNIKEDISHYVKELDTWQKQAFINCLENKNIAVIKGPPGTGKTEVISKLIEFYSDIGEITIFASALHSAIDSLIVRMNEKLKNRNIIRSSRKNQSIEYTNFEKDAERIGKEIYLTTFASHNFDSTIESKKGILIIDEASATNLFGVLSKTIFAKKIIIVGDNNQLYPIVIESEEKEMYRRQLGLEFDSLIKKSLFDNIFKFNRGMITLLNNYRSTQKIVDKVNFFYAGKLNKKSPINEEGDIKLIKVKTKNELINLLKTDIEKEETLFLTYFKDDVKFFNKKLGENLFRTTASIQGIESNNLIYVLIQGKGKVDKYQIDYRSINVALSRAKKNIKIIDYSSIGKFLSDELIIKRDEDDGYFLRKGKSFILSKIINDNN